CVQRWPGSGHARFLHDALPISALGRAVADGQRRTGAAARRGNGGGGMSEHDCPFPGNCAACVTRWWEERGDAPTEPIPMIRPDIDRKSTRLNSSHVKISYAVFC